MVDRFKVRPDIKQRLAESFETALNLADGIAMVANMDDDAEEKLFSAKHACPLCDYSLSELEPRIFSFNNPAGACPECDGLGVKQFFAAEKSSLIHSLALPKALCAGGMRAIFIIFTCSPPWLNITNST